MEAQIINVYSVNSDNESGSSEELAPAVEGVPDPGEIRRPPPRFPSPPATITISSDEDEIEPTLVPAAERVPGPQKIRRALRALRPPEGSIVLSSDDEEDEVEILCPTVPECQQRLDPDADLMPGSSRPDTSVPLRSKAIAAGVTANCLNEEIEGEIEDQNLDMSCPKTLNKLLALKKRKLVHEVNASKCLRKELEESKEKIENQQEELEAVKKGYFQCREELSKRRNPSEKSHADLQLELVYQEQSQKIEKLRAQLEKEKKKPEAEAQNHIK